MKRPAYVPANWIETENGWAHPSRVRGGLGAGEPKPNQGRSLVARAPAQEAGNAGVAVRDNSRHPDGRSAGAGKEGVLVVTLLVRKRKLMDEHDNLKASLKPLVDAIAASLRLEDKDPRLRWQYAQVKTTGTLGVTVTMELETKT